MMVVAGTPRLRFTDRRLVSTIVFAERLQERQGHFFKTFDNGIRLAEKLRRMRIGHRQTFHAGAPGAANPFFGILDDDAVGGFDGCVVWPRIQRRKSL